MMQPEEIVTIKEQKKNYDGMKNRLYFLGRNRVSHERDFASWQGVAGERAEAYYCTPHKRTRVQRNQGEKDPRE
jgi:hypothetical protein